MTQSVALEVFLVVTTGLALIVAVLFVRLERYRRHAYEEVQKKLAESENRYFDLVQHAPDPIVTLNALGFLQSVNLAAEQVSGYSSSELLGKHFTALGILPPASAVKALREFTLTVGGQKRPPFELQILRKAGMHLDFEVNSRPLVHQGKAVGIQVIFRDIAGRKRLEEQLRRAQKMEALGQLAGGVAHDFNNVLTVINGYTSLRLELLKPDDPLRHEMEEIARAGERAATLVNQLLAFARRQVPQLRVINLNELVMNLEKMLQRLIPENIKLTVLATEDLGAVKVDPAQIEQVLVNLVVNARDAMPEGGKLLIETRNVRLDKSYGGRYSETKPGDYVLLAVSDTGTGMNEEVKTRIFEPFFTTKEAGKGTGLGLATSYGIVKQNGGSIEVYSEVGKGTSFKVYLPKAYEPVEPVRVPEASSFLSGGKETVLVAEDDELVRNFATRVLRGQGYDVLEVKSGQEAIGLLESSTPKKVELLITDMIMPGIGGRELADRLKQKCPSLKVIFTSGYMENMTLSRGMLKDGETFLQKPFSPYILTNKIREILDH